MKKCDLQILGKYILTMDRELSVVKDGTIIIDSGNIIDIGTDDSLKNKYIPKEIINTGNSIIMPGLINTHTHAAMAYFRGIADDLPLKIWLEDHIWPSEAKFVNPDFIKHGTELACLEMIRSGTTFFNDMYFFSEVTADIASKAGVRAMLGEAILDFPTPSCSTVEVAINKSLLLQDMYEKNELIQISLNPHSVYTCNKESLIKISAIAKEKQFPIHIHVSETQQEYDNCLSEHGMTPITFLNSLGIFSNHTVAAHCVWMNDEDMETCREKQVCISHNPASNMKLASGVAPIKKMQDNGIIIGLGTDGAASNNTLDIFNEMRLCALLHKVINNDPTAVTAIEVVKMATINGAKVLGMDGRLGSLEIGKCADIITIDLDHAHTLPIYNLYSHLAYCVNSNNVSNVIVNGKVIMKDRKILTLDEEKIIMEAKKFSSVR